MFQERSLIWWVHVYLTWTVLHSGSWVKFYGLHLVVARATLCLPVSYRLCLWYYCSCRHVCTCSKGIKILTCDAKRTVFYRSCVCFGKLNKLLSNSNLWYTKSCRSTFTCNFGAGKRLPMSIEIFQTVQIFFFSGGKFRNITDYLNRIKTQYFPDWDELREQKKSK